jgi:peroxiredoxin
MAGTTCLVLAVARPKPVRSATNRELVALGANVFGLSTQTTEYQREMAGRLHLPFEILSDVDLRFATALRLPTFEVDGMRLIKRLTLIAQNGAIEHVFYPVFPPDKSASEVVGWLGGLSEPPGV